MSPSRPALPNAEIAAVLERVGDLLEAQDASPFRVGAYRRASAAIRVHSESLVAILERGGVDALDALPTIGPTIAAHIAELSHRGSLTLLDRLEGEVSPERLFATVGGIGPTLAQRVHAELEIETLEDLEQAAHDGRLESVAGFGPRRVHAVREQLAAILGRSGRQRARRREHERDTRRGALPRPDVETILAVDADYRDRAARGALRRIAPRRFNPEHRAWLPMLHVERADWHFTALFSNTARAHELGRTDDWVVVFYERNGDAGQCTVVTETRGPLRGQRVVRGREAEGRARGESGAEASAPDHPSAGAPASTTVR
jgi:Holliday junction resolvasome RuvABC DNA-binding subunit